MIEQHDQVKPLRFKFVLGGVCYKKFEFGIALQRSLSQVSNCHIGKVDDSDLPAPASQP